MGPRPAPAALGASAQRRPDIQGLRAVAVVMVVLFHARLPISGGFTGVDVFFVISGFVITTMLSREWHRNGRIDLGRFYLRRMLRLAPAIGLVVGVVALVSVLLLSPFGPQQTMAATGLGAVLWSANFVIGHAAGDYFAVTAKNNPLLNTWSLSVEQQFYVIFPMLLFAGWLLVRRHSRSSRGALTAVVGVSVLSLVVSLLWTSGSDLFSSLTAFFGGPEAFAFYGPFSRVWEFGVGAVIAILVAGGLRLTSTQAQAAGIVGLGLILTSAAFITSAMPFPGAVAMVPVLAAALLILGGTVQDSPVTRVLSTRPMTIIGDWSYSWYLWHWPAVVFTAMVLPGSGVAIFIAAIASLLPAWLSYRYVETPLRRQGAPVRSILTMSVSMVVPAMLCLGLIWGANTGWGGRFAMSASSAAAVVEPQVRSAGSDLPNDGVQEAPLVAGDGEVAKDTTTGDLRAQHAAVKAGCVNSNVDGVRCRFGPSPSQGTVLLLGDSQAYAVADGVINAAAQLGYATVVSSRTGCPFLGRPASGANDRPCRPWQKSALAYALKSKPDLVMISNRSAGYVHPEIKWRTAATDTGGAATSISQAASLWRQGIEGVVAPLRKAGIPVVIISAVPEMPEFSDQRSLFSQAFGSQAYEVRSKDAIASRKPADVAERSVAAKYPGTTIFDPIPALCAGGVCLSAVDGVMRYQDETHLTVDGALLLTPGIRMSLMKALPG